jgi:hypothetical protein
MLLTEQIEGERWSRKAPRVGDDAPTELTSATLSGEARRGSGGANGDAPPSRSARGFESMQEAPGAGVRSIWQRRSRPPEPPHLPHSKEVVRSSGVRIRGAEGARERRLHVDREVTASP